MQEPILISQVIAPWKGFVRIAIIRSGGETEIYASENARVDAGANAFANNISGTQGGAFKYVAGSTDTANPAKGDTTLPAEITTGGLARATGTFGGYTAPSTLGGNFQYTITWQWTASAGFTLAKLGLFNAATGGTLGLETLLGSTITVVNGNVLNGTWTCNG